MEILPVSNIFLRVQGLPTLRAIGYSFLLTIEVSELLGELRLCEMCDLVPEFTLEAVAEVLSWSARSPRMGEVFVQLLEQIWPDDTLSSA